MTVASTRSVSRTRAAPYRQRGVALVALVFVLVVAAAFLLLRDMNANTSRGARARQSALALAAAKQALIAYAARYPWSMSVPDPARGPGYLPCPDTNNDGSSDGACAAAGFALGRLPWRTLDLDDQRDGAGEQLWYALSRNYRNNPAAEPLNSETPGQLTVDTATDVVAVVIAPGEPIGSQTGRVSNLATDYLDVENADNDSQFSSTGVGEFNDQVEFISRRELMAAVEMRVLNEVAKALDSYRSTYGAYPWLSPFADPKLVDAVLTGTATSGSTGNTLEDDDEGDFLQWGLQDVTVPARVYNLTDGSSGLVSTVTNDENLTVVSLSGGGDDQFQEGDRYLIRPVRAPARLAGTAGGASSGLTLVDPSRDFEDLGITPGDIVEVQYGTAAQGAGMVTEVEDDTLRVRRLTGGTAAFAAGQSYRLRARVGIADGATGADQLVDSTRDFRALGVAAGDVVENLSTGAIGIVAAPTTASVTGGTLLVAERFGAASIGAPGDGYRITRYNPLTSDPAAGVPLPNARTGLLPMHQPGQAFATGFHLEWSLRATDGAAVVPVTPDAEPAYQTFLKRFAETSVVSGAIPVAFDSGACIWLDPAIVECRGTHTIDFIAGTATAGSGGAVLEDTTKGNFAADWGVQRGDLLENPATGDLIGIVDDVGATTLTVVKQAAPITAGMAYAIRVATTVETGTIDGDTGPPGLDFIYSGAPGLQLDDYIVRTTPGDEAIGRITALAPGFNLLSSASLEGGSTVDLSVGDTFEVRRNFVKQRRYAFNLRFMGNPRAYADGGEKRRSVCIGYGSACADLPANATVPARPDAATITISDTDASGIAVGVQGAVTLPTAIPGQIRVQSLRYQLWSELPAWFSNNRWHELVGVAYVSGDTPGGAGGCTVGVNCIVLDADAVPNQNKRAVVVMAGAELPSQDRASGAAADYFEAENDDGDDTFTRVAPPAQPFNDRVRVIATAP